jgi:hypothetical protein
MSDVPSPQADLARQMAQAWDAVASSIDAPKIRAIKSDRDRAREEAQARRASAPASPFSITSNGQDTVSSKAWTLHNIDT